MSASPDLDPKDQQEGAEGAPDGETPPAKKRAPRTSRAKAAPEGQSSRSRRASSAPTSGGGRGDGRGNGRSAAAAEEAQSGSPARSRLFQQYMEEVVPVLRREFGYENAMEVPSASKVVINIGLGEALTNSNALDAAVNDLATIAGQRPVVTRARKSIANFKLREGMAIGAMVTLRGSRMWQFLDRLMNAALPRVRDFHGVPRNSFDGRGNYTLGLREQVVFPEIDYNRIDRLRGLQITVVTTARTDEEARRLLELLGMPFTRVDQPVLSV